MSLAAGDGAYVLTVLRTARQHTLTWTAAATVAHIGTHSPCAESERSAIRSLDA
jgi:hypothetical protein